MMIFEKITKVMTGHATTIQAALCTRCRTPKSDCTLCADQCPAGAITLSGAGPEIGLDCLDCGVCYAVCPTGAFERKQEDDEEIIADLGRLAGKESCRISCWRGETDADLLVSCLGRLTERLLLQPLHFNPMIRLEIRQPLCEECQMSKSVASLSSLLTRSGHFYDLLGAGGERISITRISLQPLSRNSIAGQNDSRREFLGAIRGKAVEVMNTALSTEQAKTGASTPVSQERPENRKRAALLGSLRALAEKYELKSISIPTCESITAPLAVNSRCTACGACAAICPVGALKWNKTSEMLSLAFRADLCVNCGICIEICRQGAVERHEDVLLGRMLTTADVELFAAPHQECRVCRIDFIGQGVDGICPLCMDLHRRQQNTLKNLFATMET
ncbi:MAG: hypothetical protein A2505_11045 [Deltaproteobacteria bacterium RIFOXYD12_FULL_55_16]|nr:MAG: hypothetical protein A2505_11045 [Deltaproteobacteria bacterium RIFOXYD12_FULL_55_16]